MVVKRAWQKNLKVYQNNAQDYFNQIAGWLTRYEPEFFRFHVGGDIPDQLYFFKMVQLASEFPDVKILTFTKNFELDFSFIPDNLSVVLSMWPGMRMSKKWDLPKAWCQDGTETRVPDDALECPGGCIDCGLCWHLKNLNKDVVFKLH